MNNFTYHNPVKVVFGKDSIARVADLLAPDAKVLMTYGGGSIKRNGVYDQVSAALANHDWLEFGGIEPNPRYENLMRAVELARKESVDFLLAVGGGSVLDGTKFVAAAIPYRQADPWDMLSKQAPFEEATPLGAVLTLPATGSEMNTFAVISRESTGEKLAFGNPVLYPKFSILDPTVTMTLPEHQVANGVVDAFAHVIEQYMTYPVDAPLQDRQAEALLLTLMEEGPITLKDPKNYEARANLMWCATMALNGMIACGVPQDWSTHMIGHELTALYGLDHAQTLAIVLPGVLTRKKDAKRDKLAQFARRIARLEGDDQDALARAAIERIETFFHSLGIKTRLSDYGVPANAADKVAERLGNRGVRLGEHEDIDGAEAGEILKLRV